MTPSNGARKVTRPHGFSRRPCPDRSSPLGLLLAFHPPALGVLSHAFLSAADLLGLGMEGVDLLLGNVPRLEVVEGPVDGVAVSLHGAL